ncbi:hypothetical protein HW555_008151 [Spodoptera exigua]|uniref:HAT C-terminal dimerisation domain-containing protein n=1 Tax=Spodoptera exigua TaxID=7107 RepID=A0A835GBL2_SPOEX|nr:hypothetical protein HW555_008151 [Spodoptera exigua]
MSGANESSKWFAKLGPECNYSVCLTTDLWTSRSNESYIAVTGHYMTDNFELKLNCRNSENSHTSENIQEMLTNVVAEWRLTNKINFVVSDNAAYIQKVINNIGWKHYGCYGHSLNLIVQDALIFIQPLLEKVKKIVRHYKTSSTALEKLLKAQTDDKADCIPKRLIQEVPTRWNSTFQMVKRFVELEQYLRATMAILKKDLPIISNEEWLLLYEISKNLQPFDQATETINGEKYMTGSLVIVMTRCLLTACEKFIGEPFYENEARNTNIYVQEMLVAMIAEESSQESSLPSASAGSSNTLDGFRAILNEIVGQKQHPIGTPLSKAIKEIDTDDPLLIFHGAKWSCPLKWWRVHKFNYPHLAKLVQKYRNIMASSVPCERIFSKTGLIISDRRTRLTSQKVKQLTFLNVNLDEKRFI